MGRKKRRVSATGDSSIDAATDGPEVISAETQQPLSADPSTNDSDGPNAATTTAKTTISSEGNKTGTIFSSGTNNNKDGGENNTNTTTKAKEPAKASNYAMTSHSGEIVEEDIYVSDGSEDDDDHVEVVLSGSKMGLMRRGLHQPLQLVQPNLRQWVRPEATDGNNEESEEQQRQKEEEELAKLDPAERAARLLQEKQRKLEEAKESARRLESEENAGRDPCLFSKRTAFDIRFDQIDDKPWERGAGDLTDFFNYGLTVEDWLEYAQQQLTIRQELTDANRQKRPPDPNIVPVAPRKPSKQTPKVAVAAGGDVSEDGEKVPSENGMDDDFAPVIGPTLIKKEEADDYGRSLDYYEEDLADIEAYQDIPTGSGGAWGAGAAPDSVLARLIEEQTQKDNVTVDVAEEIQSQNHVGTAGGGGAVDHYGDKRSDHAYDEQRSTAGDSYDGRASTGYDYDGRGSTGYDYDEQSHGDRRQQQQQPPRTYHARDDSGGRFSSYRNDDGGRGRFSSYGRGDPSGGRFNMHGNDASGGGQFNPYGHDDGGRGRFSGHDDGGRGRFNGYDDGGRGRFNSFGGRGRGRGSGGFGGRFNPSFPGRAGRGGPRPPFPPHGQRWGGRRPTSREDYYQR